MRKLQTNENSGTSERVQNFKSSIADGPSFYCCSCKRLLFKNGVKPVTATMKQEMGRELFEKCIVIHNSCNSPLNICLTCCNWLTKKKKVPPLNAFNGLELDDVPTALAQLSDIENVLISKNILFLKIFKLPRSRWNALIDRVVNVPINDCDILKSLSSIDQLPRNFSQSGLIPIKLKRKVSYKNVVMEAYVNADNLFAALQELKDVGHPSYAEVITNSKWSFSIDNSDSDSDLESEDSEDNSSESEGSISSVDSDDEETTRSHATMLASNYPEASLTESKKQNSSEKSVSIAPGEGKIPSNLMRDMAWDINAFPFLLPTGKFGLHHPRKHKISPQQYFLQRILNQDMRFSRSVPYVFAALYYIERGGTTTRTRRTRRTTRTTT
jgi:hypothetical protein